MRLTVLVDNNTLIDRYFYGEPGVSYFIETEEKKVLFDTGFSDLFIQNAQKLQKDLLDLDYLVLSHGHIDHTGGLGSLLKLFTEKTFENSAAGCSGTTELKRAKLVAHPSVFTRKFLSEGGEIGTIVNKSTLSLFFDMILRKKPVFLTDHLVFLGEIERNSTFEAQYPVGKTLEKGTLCDDFLLDDSALVYISGKGLVIITGCSHSGICNIIEYARKVTGVDRVLDIIGGFHLLGPSENQIEETVSYIKRINPAKLHACHCTDLSSKMRLSTVTDMGEVGSGLILEYPER